MLWLVPASAHCTGKGKHQGSPEEPLRPLRRCATTTTVASRGPHTLKPRSGLSAAICLTSCTALVHGTALGARTAWGSHLLSPPACVVPQGLPRSRAHRDDTRASWCGPPLPHPTLHRAVGRGGELFAHAFASFSRTTRPATHPPFLRRFPGRASAEPLCTRVAADACGCRLCPDLATCVVAHAQHGSWRARSCACVYGIAGEQDRHSRLPSATMSAGEPSQPCVSCATGALALSLPPPFIHPPRPPPPETCACLLLLRAQGWDSSLLCTSRRHQDGWSRSRVVALQVEPEETAPSSSTMTSTTNAQARAPTPRPCFPCLELSRSPLPIGRIVIRMSTIPRRIFAIRS